MGWFGYSLISSLCWAGVQIVDKTLVDGEAPSPLHYLFVSGFSAIPVFVFLPLFFPVLALPSWQILVSVVAGILYFAANGLIFYAILRLDASLAAAALAAVPASAAIGSWLFLGEGLEIVAAGSIGLITLGVVMMSIDSPDRAERGESLRTEWLMIAGAVVLLVLEYLLEARVVRDATAPQVFYWSRGGVILATLLLGVFLREKALEALSWAFRRRRHVGLLTLGNEGLDMVAQASLIAAYARGPVGLSTAVAYSNPALVFGGTVLINSIWRGAVPTEGDVAHHYWRMAGLVLVVAGIFLSIL